MRLSRSTRNGIKPIRAGRAAQVSAAQGLDRIWYSGSLLSHYNLESIHRFNYDLANQIRDSVEQRSLKGRLHARAVAFLNSL
jgi:hypothetical protein